MTGVAIRAGALAVGLAAVALAASAGTAQDRQQDKQEQRPIFRGGANVVRVDVAVSTRRGEPVTNLTRDDFEVTEDGVPQKVDSFQLVRATGEPTDDRSLPIRSPAHAAAEAGRDDVRLFLIFWDEYHIGQFIPALRGREILTAFVRTAFGPTDLVGIMDQLTTLDSIKFTRDRYELANQVHALKGRFGVLLPPRSVVEEAHMMYPRDIPRLRNEVTMSALTAAAAFLGNFREGRKALLFVSQGIPVYGRSGETQRYQDIVRAANANNTAIYTLDPGAQVGSRPSALLSLAYDTGGRPFVGTNDPGLLLPQMLTDSSAYYLLGYTSPAPVDGKFHKIGVRVKKEGYEVRARSGYFAPSLSEMQRGREEAAAAVVPTDVARALGELSAGTRADRLIDLWIGMAGGDAGRTRVTLAWTPRGTAVNAAGIGLTATATAADGTAVFSSPRTTARVVTFDAVPGEIVLTATAVDERGEEIDGERRRLMVPAFDNEHLAIGTPIVLRARSPFELRAIASGKFPDPEVGRVFDRADRLFIRFPVYGGDGATVAAHVLNRQAAPLRALTAERVEGLYQIDLPLSATARGDYLVAIEATHRSESTRVIVPIRVR